MDRITFRCKKCGWKKTIVEAYKDLKPKRCLGKKCRTFFTIEPDMLELIFPEKKPVKRQIIEETEDKKSWKKTKRQKKRS